MVNDRENLKEIAKDLSHYLDVDDQESFFYRMVNQGLTGKIDTIKNYLDNLGLEKSYVDKLLKSVIRKILKEKIKMSATSSSYARMSENSIPQSIAANETDDLPF